MIFILAISDIEIWNILKQTLWIFFEHLKPNWNSALKIAILLPNAAYVVHHAGTCYEERQMHRCGGKKYGLPITPQ